MPGGLINLFSIQISAIYIMNVGGWKCLFRELGIAITNGKFSQKLSNSFLREAFCDFFPRGTSEMQKAI